MAELLFLTNEQTQKVAKTTMTQQRGRQDNEFQKRSVIKKA